MKKLISVFMALALMLSVCACDFVQPVKAEETPAATDAPISGVANPVQEASAESIMAELGIDMSAVNAYENAAFSIINGDPRLAQANFEHEGDSYCFRIAPTAAETEIDGMYYTWDSTQSVDVGYCTASLKLTNAGQGVISWFDIAPGVMYALSMSENATADKLASMANALFVPTQGEADGDFAQVFADAFANAQQSYRPGTAGSSLTAASSAAALADLFAQYAPTADAVTAAVAQYAAELDAQSRSLLASQVAGIEGAYKDMNANGIGILSDAGCTSSQYPWDDAIVAPLFAAMTELCGNYCYDSVLEAYYTALYEQWDRQKLIDEGINDLLADCGEPRLDVIGYQIVDLDGDGSNELLIGTITDEEFYSKMILVIYHLDEIGEPSVVFSGWERNRMYYAGGNRFAHQGSSGADDSFDSTEEFTDGELVDLGSATDPANYVQAELTPFSALDGAFSATPKA